jgi:2-dehydropantoate 2-reductase
MKILVYGAGAIGGYLGGRLLQQEHEVSMITREVSAEIISNGGLFITEGDSQTQVNPLMLTSVVQAFEQKQQYDLIIMSMKSYDLVTALDALVAFCPNPPTIMTTQNGIGVERPLIDQFGAERIISGAVTIPISKETTDRIIVEKTDRGLALAPTQPKQNIKQWQALFSKAGILTESFSNYHEVKWSKALLNIVTISISVC